MDADPFFDFSPNFGDNITAIMTKKGELTNNSNENRLADCCKKAGVNFDSAAVPIQTHSDHVKFVSISGNVTDTDGLITDQTDIILTLSVADCVPVFMWDEQTGIFGLIHSGWKGTAKNIVGKAVDQFIKKGSNPNDISVLTGPSICGDCYEIGDDSARYFKRDALKKLKKNKWLLDLRYVITNQLIDSGVPENLILIDDRCTLESEKCESYRRDGIDAGRMTALMWKTN